MITEQHIDTLKPAQLREALRSMLVATAAQDRALTFKQAVIDKLTRENAVLKRIEVCRSVRALQR